MDAFSGFPVEALDFYDDLEQDNTKTFWSAHKDTYESTVRVPMTALTDALAPEFGTAKLFRPYRDVRFANDKTPYKTHQGAFVAAGPSTGWYVQVGAPGVDVGVGFFEVGSPRLAGIRAAIAHDLHGPALQRIVDELVGDGWALGGQALKTSPRGYDARHPRIELLRHTSLTLRRSYGFEPFIHTPELLERVRDDWRAGRGFVEWVDAHGGG